MLPHVDSDEGLNAALADRAVWPPVIAGIRARHGLPPAEARASSRGSFAVFFSGDHVVKLVPLKWRAKLDAERRALVHVAGKLPVPTPELVASGELDGWGYLVMTRLEGERIGDLWAQATPEERRDVLRRIGELMRALHALPTAGLEALTAPWPGFVAEQQVTAVERHAGADPAWLLDVAPFLARVAPACARPARTVLVTADITDDHILLARRRGRLELTGLIDFGDALVGDPMYDFVSPVTFLVEGRQELLAALLDGYGTPPGSRDQALRDRFLAYELLHRFAQLRRDVARLSGPPPRTLDAVGRALWPLPGG